MLTAPAAYRVGSARSSERRQMNNQACACIDHHASAASSANPSTNPKRRDRPSNASRLTIANPASKQLSTRLSARPVRQFDQGANTSSETAAILIPIPPTPTPQRPPPTQPPPPL